MHIDTKPKQKTHKNKKFFLWWELLRFTVNNFPIHHTAVLAVVITLYITSLVRTYLIPESLYHFTTFLQPSTLLLRAGVFPCYSWIIFHYTYTTSLSYRLWFWCCTVWVLTMLWATPHWKRHLQKIFAYSVCRLCILSTVSFTAQRPFSSISPTCVWVCFFRPRRQIYKRIARANVRFYCLCFILENFWFWVLYIGF